MNKEAFVRAYKKASSHLDKVQLKENAKVHTDVETRFEGSHQLVVVCEECAELQQEISKFLRGKGDRIHLIEEMGDVMLSLEYLKSIFNITNGDLNKAMNVKIERQRKRNEEAKQTPYRKRNNGGYDNSTIRESYNSRRNYRR